MKHPDSIFDLLTSSGFDIRENKDGPYFYNPSTRIRIEAKALEKHTVETFRKMAQEKGWLGKERIALETDPFSQHSWGQSAFVSTLAVHISKPLSQEDINKINEWLRKPGHIVVSAERPEDEEVSALLSEPYGFLETLPERKPSS